MLNFANKFNYSVNVSYGENNGKKVLIPLAPGFEEIETITVVDVLRRAGARVILGGTERGPIKGSRGILVMPDAPLEIQSPKDFDMIVLPGGQLGTTNLENNPGLIHFLKTMNQEQNISPRFVPLHWSSKKQD